MDGKRIVSSEGAIEEYWKMRNGTPRPSSAVLSDDDDSVVEIFGPYKKKAGGQLDSTISLSSDSADSDVSVLECGPSSKKFPVSDGQLASASSLELEETLENLNLDKSFSLSLMNVSASGRSMDSTFELSSDSDSDLRITDSLSLMNLPGSGGSLESPLEISGDCALLDTTCLSLMNVSASGGGVLEIDTFLENSDLEKAHSLSLMNVSDDDEAETSANETVESDRTHSFHMSSSLESLCGSCGNHGDLDQSDLNRSGSLYELAHPPADKPSEDAQFSFAEYFNRHRSITSNSLASLSQFGSQEFGSDSGPDDTVGPATPGSPQPESNMLDDSVVEISVQEPELNETILLSSGSDSDY